MKQIIKIIEKPSYKVVVSYLCGLFGYVVTEDRTAIAPLYHLSMDIHEIFCDECKAKKLQDKQPSKLVGEGRI